MSQELVISQKQFENLIFTIRGVQVMIDRDLAEMYQTETKFINRAVKRNPDRFPESFVFQLKEEEWEDLKFQMSNSKNEPDNLRFQPGTSSAHGGRRYAPYVFSEQGVAMLSAVLQTPLAVKVSVQIIHAFVEMRKLLAMHNGLLQRMEGLEGKQVETDHKFELILQAREFSLMGKCLMLMNLPPESSVQQGKVLY